MKFLPKLISPKLLAALFLVSIAATAQAPLDIRVALVIGNAAYAGNAALANPANDARAMAETLRQLGFTVVELRDSGKSDMSAAIDKVRAALKDKQGVGMLYYAGHGMQLDWHNYMVPVDAKLASAADVPAQAIDVNVVLDAFKSAGNRMNILVLDACRNNPFASTASGKGLAQVDAPPGTFLAYATAPGNVAEDGDVKGGNGLYTQYLLEELKKPAARIEDVFKRVRLNVRKQSQGRQIPWESTSLEDDFYFNRGSAGPPAQPEGKNRDAMFSAEKADWDRIKDSKAADSFYAFLQKYPTGFMSELAQFQLDLLAKASITPQIERDGVIALPVDAIRYPVGTVMVYSVKDVYGKVRPERRLEVTDLRDGKIIINGGLEVWDEMGNLVKDAAGTRSPAKAHFPSELAIGKKWHSAYENLIPSGQIDSLYWDFRVEAFEEIVVPAGKFKAFRVEGTSRVSNGAYQTETYWIDPARMLIVKDVFVYQIQGRTTNDFRRELVSYKRG